MLFTLEQIASLSPDDASLKAAKGLASPGKWVSLGADEVALWGECQGSGAKPYQVQMDFAGPAFRCSCPSRKFPCKHGLGLLLLHTNQTKSFTESTPPAWVQEWLDSRRQKAEKQEQKKSDAPPPDPLAAAKREAKRVERMTAGADELQRWLLDQTRQGLANLRGANVDWRGLAARMVDAQATGLGRRVQVMESLAAGGEDWAARLLGAMGQTQLLLDGWRRLAELNPAQQADLRTAMGWATDKEEVMHLGERVADQWEILGLIAEENDKLWERRVWLRGRDSGRDALLLDFAHGKPAFEQLFSVGAVYRMTLAFYPSAYLRRALALDAPTLEIGGLLAASADWEAEFSRVADALAANPWAALWPMRLAEALVYFERGTWLAVGPSGLAMPLQILDDEAWQLTALSGGRLLTLFGEWDGARLRPLSAWAALDRRGLEDRVGLNQGGLNPAEPLIWIAGGSN
jgi:hypothetical protein